MKSEGHNIEEFDRLEFKIKRLENENAVLEEELINLRHTDGSGDQIDKKAEQAYLFEIKKLTREQKNVFSYLEELGREM